ncbi:hypothetical protein LAUMK7_05135 [Mycobacterium kansasii]|nr:hypothetical protein MKANGN_23380 [Mycobacterium kansasii]VAZ62654.1 hypothetical protein LAUMK22_04478 [Mycobacterium kansasii]VAZ69106.1 hypothetical protein LAUMK40_05262 [Mycobacterium kansasii]VAZ80065.1 hypothetical protein LAUMK7_05135 [Mycobacterium kansasii]
MSPSFYLGAYLGIRAASVDECAQRLTTLIEQFAHVDPLLTGWRQGAGSKRRAIEQPVVISDHTDLVTRLLAGRNRRDTNRQVIDELGYSVSWWNGNPDASIGLSVGCGRTSPYVTNSFILNLPKPGAGSGHIYDPAVAAKLLNIVVDTWQPDHAVWTNHDLVDKQRQPDQRLENGGIIAGQLIGHPAGWANLLSDSDSVKFDMALLPAGATVERLGTGTLVLLGQDPANPPLRDVLQVRRAMGYEVPTQRTESSEDVDAASAGPAATPTAPGASVNPTDRGQSDPRPGIETRGVGYPESNTDAQRSDAPRGTTAHD